MTRFGRSFFRPNPSISKLRCAVYTRKSSEEGLEQEFNSLDAQREACEAYIASQRSEGWKRLQQLGEQLDGGNITTRRVRADLKPIVGTRLIREWQGVEHTVTVTLDGFEWQGRPYQSLSAIARAVTGSRWNGWVFFGLKDNRRAA